MGLAFKAEQIKRDFTVSDRRGSTTFTPVPGTFIGDIQPVTASDIDSSEARVQLGMIKVYSEDKLKVPEQAVAGSERGTYVLFRNKWYELTEEAVWESPADESYDSLRSLDHYKYFGSFREKFTT